MNNITFKFDFQTDSEDCAYSLMNVLMEKLKTLGTKCSGVKYVEVNLFSPEETTENKTAFFRLVSDKENITGFSKSKRWEDALLNAFDKVHAKIAM
ncbi:MAG TPA: hypothetical protein VM012_11070 [Flavitalea sp.]|nr:hypothetical protein [Flavitalea sp.]